MRHEIQDVRFGIKCKNQNVLSKYQSTNNFETLKPLTFQRKTYERNIKPPDRAPNFE